MHRCPNCSKELQDDARFCPYCGQKVIQSVGLVCPSCGVTHKDPHARFCSNCGSRLVTTNKYTNTPKTNRSGACVYDLGILINELNNYVVRIDKNAEPLSENEIVHFSNIENPGRYDTFYIHKKRKGRYRMISSPTARLKLILRSLNLFLQDLYEPAKYVTGFTKGTSIVDNGRIHVGKRYVFTLDLADFFETIKLNSIEKFLCESPLSFNISIAKTIAALSCVKNQKNGTICLSQGSPLSPVLSNIACTDLDKKLHGLSSFYGTNYSRYADDITFSSDTNVFGKNLGEFSQSVKRIIEAESFRINEEKVHIHGPQACHYVTGVVTNEKLNVTRKYIRDIRNLLYIWEKYGIRDAYIKFDELWQKKNKGKRTPFIGDYLRGRIGFVGAVKGTNDPVFLRYKNKLESLLAIPFKPFCGKYDYSTHRFIKRHGWVNFYLKTPMLREGIKYYTAITRREGALVLISPKLNEFIESGAVTDLHHTLAQRCSYYRIFDKDGVKILMTKK